MSDVKRYWVPTLPGRLTRDCVEVVTAHDHDAEIERLRGLLREWHDKDWKRTASECLPKNHLVLRTRSALAGEKP